MLMTITDELRNKYSISRIRQKTSYLKQFKKMEVASGEEERAKEVDVAEKVICDAEHEEKGGESGDEAEYSEKVLGRWWRRTEALEAEGRKRLRGLIALCEFVYVSDYFSIFHRV